MSYKLYDHESQLEWAHTGRLTVDQMKENPQLRGILTNDTVLMCNAQGIVYDFRYLDDMKRQYEVDIDDPEDALAEIIEKMSIVPMTNDERDDILAYLLLDQASAEETQDLAIECIFDLYAKIDELTEKLEAMD